MYTLMYAFMSALNRAGDGEEACRPCPELCGGTPCPPTNRECPTPSSSERLGAILYRHDWAALEDWVRAVHDVADCTDDQIDQLVRASENQFTRAG